ncbi:MAG: DUF2029 domain-containing protein [Anaerolineae bacterium]|nr:DUF2029 domain-containing protein [Anaerolineae bacterium]
MKSCTTFSERQGTRIWKLIFWINLSIAISYVGLGIIAARQDLLWRADFTAYYTGAMLVRDGHGSDLYNLELQARYQQMFLHGNSFQDGVLPFNYPPYFALFLFPLAYFPLRTAFLLWTITQICALGYIIYILWLRTSSWDSMIRWLFLGILLAFPPLMRTILQGTSSILTLLCLFLIHEALLSNQPRSGGVWFALGTFRPQAMVPIGLFILWQRHWKLAIAAISAGATLVLLTTLTLGVSVWQEFISSVWRSGELFDRFGVYPAAMYNLKGTLALCCRNLDPILITRLSSIGFLTSIVGISWLWRISDAINTPIWNLKLAIGLTVGMLFGLHLNPHDGLLLIFPLFLFVSYLHSRKPQLRTEMTVISGFPLVILITEHILTDSLPIRSPVLIMMGLLIWMGLRLRYERKILAR